MRSSHHLPRGGITHDEYMVSPTTAQCLGAYIVDLTLILHDLFLATLTMDPPRELTEDIVFETVQAHKVSEAADRVHKLVCEISKREILHPEREFAALIKEHLRMDV